MREKINRTNTILGTLSVVLVAANLFSFPFPFVRAVWSHEIWGITGIINAALFIWISSRLGKVSIPAAFAGIGMVFNYEILTASGFFYVLTHRGLYLQNVLFFAFTLLLGLFLLFLFGSILKSFFHLSFENGSRESKVPHDDFFKINNSETGMPALVISALGYLAAFAALYFTLSQDAAAQHGRLKIIGIFISPLAFGGIGQEMDYFLQGKQTRFFCIVKSMSHALALACILWIIYGRLSFAGVIR